jgi:hypothetical protein
VHRNRLSAGSAVYSYEYAETHAHFRQPLGYRLRGSGQRRAGDRG